MVISSHGGESPLPHITEIAFYSDINYRSPFEWIVKTIYASDILEYVMKLEQIYMYIERGIGYSYITMNVRWASTETYHFFWATLIKIQSIKMYHNWAQISYT